MISIIPIIFFAFTFTYAYLKVSKENELKLKKTFNRLLILMLLAIILFLIYETTAFSLAFDIFDNMETVRKYLNSGGTRTIVGSFIVLFIMLILSLKVYTDKPSLLLKLYIGIVLIVISAQTYDFAYLLLNIDKIYINLDYLPFANILTNWMTQLFVAIVLFIMSFVEILRMPKKV